MRPLRNRRRLWRGVLSGLLLFLVARHVAARPAELSIVNAKSSIELGAWERGHLRMYLDQNGLGCQLTMKKTPLHGTLRLRLDVEKNKPVRTTILDAKKLFPAAFPKCLARILAGVRLYDLAPAAQGPWQWEGTLRYEAISPYDVSVQSLYGKMMELEMRHLIGSALEQPAACMERFFSDPREYSAVMLASFDVEDGGALRNLEVKMSTAEVPDLDVATCVKGQLAALSFPTKTLTGARLRIALLRPSTRAPDDKVPTLTIRGKP